MWCASCQADVAAQVSTETGSIQCIQCGIELAQADAIRERTRDAREILERWSTKSMQDPYGPLPGPHAGTSDNHPHVMKPDPADEERAHAYVTGAPEPVAPLQLHAAHSDDTQSNTAPPTTAAPVDSAPPVDATAAKPKRTVRIDQATDVGEVGETKSNRTRARRRPIRRYVDSAHGNKLGGPHFQPAPPKQPSWAVTTGQWLAYLGVLGLTIGTVVVISGHLGGYSDYTPTGWLITTVGQMLLFLGVINLVTGGMEQSNDQVSQHIEILGERLMRIEAATDEAIRGPRIPAHRYAEGEVEETESSRESTVTE